MPPIQLQRLPRRRKPANKRALLFLGLLLIVLCTALAGCTAQAAEEQPLTKQELSATKACPKGYAVEWAGPTEMQCLKEL